MKREVANSLCCKKLVLAIPIVNSKAFRNRLSILSFLVCSILASTPSSGQIVIGSGETYQQPSASLFEVTDVALLFGGSITERADDQRTWFIGGTYLVSGGTVDARLLFDDTSLVGISGGIFNENFEIDRISDGGTSDISGGTFNENVTIDRISEGGNSEISGGSFAGTVLFSRYQGDVVIRGGEFNGLLHGTPSFTGGALPTVTFSGHNWLLNGQPLAFINGSSNVSGESGFLTGTLEDGSDFSTSLSAFGQPDRITVINVVPEPSTSTLLALGVLLFTCIRTRHDR
jgi:hypothetical protein